jgi:serine/threonine-protein kinase 24/25/MST4
MRVLFIIPRDEPPKLSGTFSAEFQDFVAQCLRKKASQVTTSHDLL